MKKLAYLILVVVIFASAFNLTAQTNAKLGYINSQELIGMMPARDSIDKKLQDYKAELENTIQTMMMEYQTKIQDYQANVASYSEIIKKTKEKDITDLESRITEFQQSADYDFQLKQQELYAPLLEKAKNAIESVADENGYTYIFDISMGTLLYFEKGDNIMPQVKTKLGLE